MRRYSVPRLAFINKCDRPGAGPWKVVNQIRSKLRHNCAAVQVPIGMEDKLQGLVDLVHRRAFYFRGDKGESVRTRAARTEATVIMAGLLLNQVICSCHEGCHVKNHELCDSCAYGHMGASGCRS